MKSNLLRQAREAKGISLQEIAAQTRISPWILQRLDAGDFAALPAGIYARAYVRAFASVVGLDPATVIREFESALPKPDPSLASDEPAPAAEVPAPVPAQAPPQDDARVRALATVREKTAGPSAMASMTLRPTAVPKRVAPPVPPVSRRRLYSAAVIDTVFLIGVNLTLLGASARACGISSFQLLESAALPMFLLFTIAAASYFVLVGGITGRTLGAYLVGIRILEIPPGPSDLQTIIRRALRCVTTETAILVGALIPQPQRRQPPPPPQGDTPVAAPRFHVMPKRLQAGR